MTRMFSPARLLSAAGFALLCLVLALGYASAQSPPAAPTVDAVTSGDTTLIMAWTAPAGATGITAYDVRHIETSADETDDANWAVEDNAWTSGTLEYTITGLTNGTEYDVQVRAVDEDDVDGAWSATTSATPADHGNTQTAATTVSPGARVWGAIDPADDEDYFKLSVPRTADYWIYTLGDLDTEGELLDSNGMSIDINDRGGVLPNPDNFFLWHKLQSGTYYIKVTGYGSTDEPYILRVREFTDTTSRSNAATLAIDGFASGTIDPKDDEDYFKLELSETTEVAIRTSGFPDTYGELYDNDGTEIASNDDGYLPGGRLNFLIRESLNAGVYYVKVSSFASSSDGPYTVYATAITEPGSAIADAQPLTLGGTAGGIIDPAGDEDYFSLTLDEPAYVIIGAASRNIDTDGMLLDDSSNPVQGHIFDDYNGFYMQISLNAGTYYVKVAGNGATDTGRYAIRATEDPGQDLFRDSCSNLPRRADISDPLYGCQWHLNNYGQFSNGAGQDIRVEEVWPTYTGSGINVAVVDHGMHYRHEDLTDNVLTAFNHNYDPGQTDIYHPYENHGTAVAGLIAAKDNSLGMRGVAPEAKIYGYNLLDELTHANIANAMSRNAATTAISNNSWGLGNTGRPTQNHALWEAAVEDGVTTGFGGKGVFYAFAAGNGGDSDNSNLDELANFYAVTAVCAVGYDDIRSDYSEAGANLWVCGPSSSDREGQPRIATTDNGHRYRSSFGGTSAATPIVAGVAALIREANSALTWRDVKLILAASARKVDSDNTGWEQGAFKYGSTTDRYNFNHEYGFGMVDAKAAVDLAENWTNLPQFREITSESGVINLPIPDFPSSGTPTTVTTSLIIDLFVGFVEFVEVNAHFNHSNFRNLTIELVSPSGAVSTLSTTARIAGPLTTEFRFGSARHLGEDAAGEWTLRIKDLERVDTGALRSWGLTIYGHGYVPDTPDIDAVTPGGGTLAVEWKAPTDPGETAITSYDLRYIRDDVTDRSDDNWSVVTGVGTPSNRSHTIAGLVGGVKYEIQVRAHNDSGHGPWSEAQANEPTTVAPATPAITSITRGDRTLAVVWTAPADTGGGSITAYDVGYIETSADETVESNWTVRDNAWRSGDLRYVIANLTNATEYDVQVRAVNTAGDGGWSDTETGTPLPDDIPITLQWEETSIEVAEDAGSVVLRAVFTTTLDTPPEADFTFDVTLTTTDVGTTQDDDYTAPPSSATFVASDFSQTDVNGQQRYRATRDFNVAIIDDTADESDEAFNVRLAYLTPGLTHLQGGPSTAVVTIKDNEHVPVTISWERLAITVGENAGSVTLRAYAVTTVDKRPEDGFSFDASIHTYNGSAAQPGDYTQVDDTVTFSRNDFSRETVNGERRYRAAKQVTVTVVDDTEDEADEDFHATVAYSTPTLPHLKGASADATVTITDNDHVPVTLDWEQSSFTVDEDAGTVTLNARVTTEIDKMPESGFMVNLTVATASGSAAPGTDFRALTTSHRFRQSDFSSTTVNGQTHHQATRDFSVTIVEDTEDEPQEEFTVNLDYSNPSLPHLRGGSAEATVFIIDNDHVPVVLGWEETQFTAEEPTSPGATTRVTLRAMAVTETDRRPENGFTFDFTVATANGTARQPDDYEQLATMATFDRSDFLRSTVDGQFRWVASRDVAVEVKHDTIDEPLETFSVHLAFVGPSVPYQRRGDLTATVTTTDDIASLTDLRTTVNGNRSVVSSQDALEYSWSVSNSGPSASTNTVFTATLDPAVTFVSATPGGACRRSGRTVTCSLGTLEANETTDGTIVVEVADTASADLEFTAVARADQLDRAPADNDDSESTELMSAPRAIASLRATPHDSRVDLSWSAPGDNGSPITRYELERKYGTNDFSSVLPVPGLTATSYRDNDVANGTEYTYRLRAVNADGEATWSKVAMATPGAAPPPVITRGGGGFGPAPVAPKFVDGFRAARGVPVNARDGGSVGEPVTATHPDDLELTYSLSGADAALFTVDEETGQIRVREGAELTIGRTYAVNLTATDSAGFGAIITVTIEVSEASFSRYDLNGNNKIERDEVIRAVSDYFKALIEKDEVIELIKLYFQGDG